MKKKQNAQICKQKNDNFFGYLQEKSKKTTNKLVNRLYEQMQQECTHKNVPKPKKSQKPQKIDKVSKSIEKSVPMILDISHESIQNTNMDAYCSKYKSYFNKIIVSEMGKQQREIQELELLSDVLGKLLREQSSIINVNASNNDHMISGMKKYIITIVELCTKVSIAICVKSNNKYYDMLSIKKQAKLNNNELVKTYITNNKKSMTLLNKLLNFASQAQHMLFTNSTVKDGNKCVIVEIQASVNQENEAPNNTNKKKLIQLFINYKQTNEIMIFDGGSARETNIVKVCEKDMQIVEKLIERKQKESNKQLKESKKQKQMLTQEKEQQKLKKVINSLQDQLKSNKEQLQQYINRALDLQHEQLVVASERASIGLLNYLNTKMIMSKPNN